MLVFEKVKKDNISDLIHCMLDSYNDTQDSMYEIDTVAEQSRMLAINAARELGRMGAAGGFQLITQEIKILAKENRKANEKNKSNVEKLNREMNAMIGVRTADVAFDLIDKIDRNLFERNCDVQAWSAFEVIKNFASTPSIKNGEKAMTLLQQLRHIYEVYHDIFIADKTGKVIGAAVRMEHLGKDVNDEEWFLGAKSLKSGTYVTDLHYSNLIQDYVVSYSCKILDENGEFAGVLTTRFNWKYILDMIDETKIGKNGEVYLINKAGVVIGARDRSLIFEKNMLKDCQGAKTILEGDCEQMYGCATERNKENHLTRVLGYAKTRGYNCYHGQGWAVLALENIK